MKMKKQLNQGFTLMELLIVILIIAVLLGLMIPDIRQVRLRQRGQESGQNLKTINMLIEQWVVDHSGIPDQTAENALTGEELENLQANPSQFRVVLPQDGNHLFCKRMGAYLSARQYRIWVSPNRLNQPSYVYAPWVSTIGSHSIVRAACFSLLDSDPRYEPRGYQGRIAMPANIPASWANGYEDVGEWIAGTPRVNNY